MYEIVLSIVLHACFYIFVDHTAQHFNLLFRIQIPTFLNPHVLYYTTPQSQDLLFKVFPLTYPHYYPP